MSRTPIIGSLRTGVWWKASALALTCGVLLGAESDSRLDFARDIKPIFREHCLSCHGPEKQQGGFRLDLRESVWQGGDSKEPAVIPHQRDRSRLIALVTSSQEKTRMPRKGDALSPAQIALLRQWIDSGAVWPETENAAPAHHEMVVTQADRDHWAFRPLRRDVPLMELLDAADQALTVREAPRRTLIRRAYFDLIGLPPAPEEIDAFELDETPGAYERLVDRLLASRHYGERWGRHWLDLARYADSDGYESDMDRPHAWPYRDWVIRALNADMPFDQFVRWQLAGDEYAPNNPDALAATGFLAAGPVSDTTPADTEENKLRIRYDELDDMLATTGSAMLGLTIGCARCHDHKYDPIPTRDYYRMLAAFQTARRANAFLSKPHREREHWLAARHREFREFNMTQLGLAEEEKFWLRQPEHFFVPVQVELYKKYGAKLKSTDGQLRHWLPEGQRRIWDGLSAAAAAAEEASSETLSKALIVFDQQAEPSPAHLLARGNVLDRSEPVTFGLLQVLQRGRTPEDYWASVRKEPALEAGAGGFVSPPTTYQRQALAEWLTDAEHGAGQLLARVIMNRLWQHHFGEGLAKTPNDLGTQGEEPADSAWLDGLATELIRQGWRLKSMHRLIMTSAVYRQSSMIHDRDSVANRSPSSPASVFGAGAKPPMSESRPHRRPVRLEAEIIRDAMLLVSGRLNRKMFGPPFRPIIPKEAIATRSKDPYPADLKDGVELWRRSIYAFVKRSVPHPFMEVFDAPDSTASCGRRNTTTVPTQALTLMNDDFVRQCALQFAQRIITEAGDDPAAQIGRAYRLALGRAPCESEFEKALRFVQSAADAGAEGIPVEGLTDLCHVLFGLNEFVYVD